MESGAGSIRDDVVNARGEMTFAEQTRMLHGSVPGCWGEVPDELETYPPGVVRAWTRATPDNDPWYDVPPGPPVLPDVDDSGYGKHRG